MYMWVGFSYERENKSADLQDLHISISLQRVVERYGAATLLDQEEEDED